MKIRKQDMPKKYINTENILYSLAKAINNKREGNYRDCNFENEYEFLDYLNSLERAGLISKKLNSTDEIDLSNYIFNINPLLSFNKKNNFIKWLNANIINIALLATNYIMNN